jgi:hypothetical protein
MLRLLCFIGITLAVSCSWIHRADEEAWVHEILQDGPPIRDLLSECEWATIDAGFPPGDRDEAGMQITSGWEIVQQPFSGKGRRFQGMLKIEPLGETGLYRLSSRVRVQANKEVHRTLDLAAADWESMADDQGRARTLLQHLMGRVQAPGLSADFYNRKPWAEKEDNG